MLYKTGNGINKFINTIFKNMDNKSKIYMELMSRKNFRLNKIKKGNFIKKIINFQKPNLKLNKNKFIEYIKGKKSLHHKFLNLIKKFNKNKRMKFKFQSQKVKKNRSIDILLFDKTYKSKPNKFRFYLKLHNNIKNSLAINDTNNLFKDLMFILFELYLKIINSNNCNIFLRRKSLQKKSNYKEIKLSTWSFEKFIYDLIVKMQLKAINNHNYEDIFIPRFLKNINNIYYRNRRGVRSINKINEFKLIGKIITMEMNKPKMFKQYENIYLNNELKIYNLIINYIKSFYKIKDFILDNKSFDNISKSVYSKNSSTINIETNKIEVIVKKKEKNLKSKNIKNLNLVYLKSKDFKIKSFSKISKDILISNKNKFENRKYQYLGLKKINNNNKNHIKFKDPKKETLKLIKYKKSIIFKSLKCRVMIK